MKTALALAAIGIFFAPAGQTGFKMDDPMCAPKYWYQVCRNPDGSWMVCGLSGPGCQPMVNGGPTPLPGSTPAPGIG